MLAGRGGHFHCRHEHAAVSSDGNDLPAVMDALSANSSRNGPTHGLIVRGVEESPGLHGFDYFRRPEFRDRYVHEDQCIGIGAAPQSKQERHWIGAAADVDIGILLLFRAF